MFNLGDKVVPNGFIVNPQDEGKLNAHNPNLKKAWQINSTVLDVIGFEGRDGEYEIYASDGNDSCSYHPSELRFATVEEVEDFKNENPDFDFNKNFYVLELEEPIDGSIFIASYIDEDGYIYGIYPETKSGLVCISRDMIKRITSAISKY